MIENPPVDASTAFGFTGFVYLASVVSYDSTANTAVCSCSQFAEQMTIPNFSTVTPLTAGQTVIVIGGWYDTPYIIGVS